MDTSEPHGPCTWRCVDAAGISFGVIRILGFRTNPVTFDIPADQA
ncbi:MAG: hypothetical protein WB608_01705 [Terracidiphilus sp.]